MTTEFVITRVFAARRELVFDCLTRPEHLAHFWGPRGTTTPVDHIVVDLQLGGAFETIMIDDATGVQYPTRGIYTRIEPPETIAWRDPDNAMISTITLTVLDDGRTEMRIHQSNAPDAFATPDARRSFETSLDRMARHLATVT